MLMKIRISSLSDGHNNWTDNVAPALIGLDTTLFTGEISVEFSVEKRTGKIPVSIQADATGKFICSRCGEEFNRKVEGKCSVMFVKRENPLPDETPGDDLRSFTPGQMELDVSAEIHDAIFLTIPYKILCRDDCSGLCPRCGTNLNKETCTCADKKMIEV